MGVAPLGPRAILFTAWTCFDEHARWYQHLSPHSACFLGGLTGRSWPLMVPPKKEIPSIASPPVLPSGKLGPSTATVAISFSLPSPLSTCTTRDFQQSPPPGFLTRPRFKRHKGPPRHDPATVRSARARIGRLRAQLRPLDTHRISPHLRPAFVAMCSAPVLPAATRGEVLAPPQGGHEFNLVFVWVDRWG